MRKKEGVRRAPQTRSKRKRISGDVIQPVGQGDALVVGFAFGQFFEPGVQITDIRGGLHDRFPVQLQDDPQNPVRAGVLGAHIQNHSLIVGHRFSSHPPPALPPLCREEENPCVKDNPSNRV
jgi:hypothetical protein